jgi:uncharacterized protein with PIN domain
MSGPDPKFIADVMLGRLARWMRFLGFDTLYYSNISDSRLIRVAREQDRFILTRDTRLIKIKGVEDYLLIKANDSFEQLLEVTEALKLKHFNPLSRCVKCNGPLTRILNKSKIKDSIPEYVFLNFNVFLKCSDCDKIYWEGTHPKKFREKLSEVLK